MNTKNRKPNRQAHHLWSAHTDEQGKISVVRSKTEPEDFDREAAADISNAYWGLWGASLVDNELLSNNIPSGIVARLGKVAKNTLKRDPLVPRVLKWSVLRKTFGSDVVDEIRKNISDGMKIRIASKYLNIPFVVTAELMDYFGDVNKQEFKSIINLVKAGQNREATRKFGSKARTTKRVYDHYSKSGYSKLAVDDQAKAYWEQYFGPFGVELTREIKKRVKADLISSWMRKNGVDEAAVEYWSSYYSDGYGADMTKDLAKKLSPVK